MRFKNEYLLYLLEIALKSIAVLKLVDIRLFCAAIRFDKKWWLWKADLSQKILGELCFYWCSWILNIRNIRIDGVVNFVPFFLLYGLHWLIKWQKPKTVYLKVHLIIFFVDIEILIDLWVFLNLWS